MASKNMFALLDSDDEETPKVKTQQQKPAAEKPVKTVKASAVNKKDGGRKDRKEGGRGQGRGAGRGGDRRQPRSNRPEGSVAPRGMRPERERGQRPDHGHHHHHGDKYGDKNDRAPKRNYERRSGTGRGKEASKSGGGARNWGNENDKTELAAEAAVQEDAAAEGEDAEAVDGEAADDEAEAPVEPEEVQLTLDEYMAKKAENRTGELFADREVRAIANDFSDAAKVTKDGKTPDFIESQYEKVYTKKTSGRKKQAIVDLGFQAPPINSRDRDDRRGGRGGRGGRGNSGRRGNAPNVSDLNAFPSL